MLKILRVEEGRPYLIFITSREKIIESRPTTGNDWATTQALILQLNFIIVQNLLNPTWRTVGTC